MLQKQRTMSADPDPAYLGVDTVRNNPGVDVCSLYLHHSSEQELELHSTSGLNPNVIGTRLPVGQGLTGKVALNESPLAARDIQRHRDHYHVEGSGEERFQSYPGIPLVQRAHLLGCSSYRPNRAGPSSRAISGKSMRPRATFWTVLSIIRSCGNEPLIRPRGGTEAAVKPGTRAMGYTTPPTPEYCRAALLRSGGRARMRIPEGPRGVPRFIVTVARTPPRVAEPRVMHCKNPIYPTTRMIAFEPCMP